MSEAILKAVALSIAEISGKVDASLSEIQEKIQPVDLSPIEKVSAHNFKKTEELSAQLEALRNEFALNKQSIIKTYDERLSALDSLNDDTIAMVSEGINKISDGISATKIEFEEKIADVLSKLDASVKGYESVQQSVKELATEFKTEMEATLAAYDERIKAIAPAKDGEDGKDGADGVGIHAPIWEPKIYRAGSIVQHNIGQMFKAVADTAADPNESTDWERVGTFGLRVCGSFDEKAEYAVGDIFVKSFSTFMAIGNGKSLLLSARGAKGDKGDKGTAGPASTVPGPAGTGIKAFHTDDSGFVVELTDGSVHPIALSGFIPQKELLEAFELAHDFASLKGIIMRMYG